MNYLLNMRTRTWISILIVALAGLYGEYRYISNKDATTTTTATDTATSTVTELENTITAVGTVVPMQKADAGFKRAGIVVSLPFAIGARIAEGTVLGTLDASEAKADLTKAKSDVLTARADLAKSNTASLNYENQKGTTVSQAYAKALDAVRKQLDPLFSNDDQLPRLTFSTMDSQVENNIYTARAAAGRSLTAWQATLANGDISDAIQRLTDIRALLYLAENALTAQASLDATTLTTYKAAVTAGLDGVNASIAAVNDLTQKLRAQASEIQAQEARVASADASVAQSQARLDQSYLRAPFTGIITDKKTEVGQFIGAGQTAFSLTGTAFEVQSDIPEVYIGKIRVGMPVSILLDAYADETIAGVITSIEPAGRPINDVVYYRVKIAVNNVQYAAFLKNGLTANITIKP
ncbi:MAG: HlyD family efflux transporter periplasmic adaptor subunit [Candidatus Pacebacteria bacterium]|nr:HlyD family efflux transporter periplasmic adaptor subunit [Candidatus Paceibacterota bacterium]